MSLELISDIQRGVFVDLSGYNSNEPPNILIDLGGAAVSSFHFERIADLIRDLIETAVDDRWVVVMTGHQQCPFATQAPAWLVQNAAYVATRAAIRMVVIQAILLDKQGKAVNVREPVLSVRARHEWEIK